MYGLLGDSLQELDVVVVGFFVFPSLFKLLSPASLSVLLLSLVQKLHLVISDRVQALAFFY